MPSFYDNPTGRGLYSERFAAVTPGQALPFRAKALYIGAGGDLTLTDVSGQNVTFTAIPGGTLLPVSADGVAAAGTTASNIVALF